MKMRVTDSMNCRNHTDLSWEDTCPPALFHKREPEQSLTYTTKTESVRQTRLRSKEDTEERMPSRSSTLTEFSRNQEGISL